MDKEIVCVLPDGTKIRQVFPCYPSAGDFIKIGEAWYRVINRSFWDGIIGVTLEGEAQSVNP